MGRFIEDTICAVATAAGEGGIGIVRVSGEKSIEIGSGLLRLHSGQSLQMLAARTLHQADVLDETVTAGMPQAAHPLQLDEALVAVMRAPHSFTGEDVVEFHCHGSPIVLQRLCECLVSRGARLAEPGEFTKRAFLNGRLDLTQAEAVLDTIRAKTSSSLRLAQQQLRGALSDEIDVIKQALAALLAHVEAAIDFTEEDIAFIEPAELAHQLQQAGERVNQLIRSYEEGRILREGVAAAIIGRPNVGKSSLLNVLLGTDRAIVTAVPGTTRDVLEEVLNIRGVPVRLLDTAGIREAHDAVEQAGIARTRLAIDHADLLLIILDGSAPLCADDLELLALSREKNAVVVVNKTDLPLHVSEADLIGFKSVVWISVKTDAGMSNLRDAIRRSVLREDFEPHEGATITRVRHRVGLKKAEAALSKAVESVSSKLPGEFVALDVRGAIDALGEITGSVTTDDILDRIFSEFCIGK